MALAGSSGASTSPTNCSARSTPGPARAGFRRTVPPALWATARGELLKRLLVRAVPRGQGYKAQFLPVPLNSEQKWCSESSQGALQADN